MEIAASSLAVDDAQIEAQILNSLITRDACASCCPSEVARALAPQDGGLWRVLMPRIRTVVAKLAREGRVLVTRGSRVLAEGEFSGGPIRIRRGPRFGGSAQFADPSSVL